MEKLLVIIASIKFSIFNFQFRRGLTCLVHRELTVDKACQNPPKQLMASIRSIIVNENVQFQFQFLFTYHPYETVGFLFTYHPFETVGFLFTYHPYETVGFLLYTSCRTRVGILTFLGHRRARDTQSIPTCCSTSSYQDLPLPSQLFLTRTSFLCKTS